MSSVKQIDAYKGSKNKTKSQWTCFNGVWTLVKPLYLIIYFLLEQI